MIVVGDLCDVGVGIYVALDIQPSCLFVDSTEITWLFSLGRGRWRGRHSNGMKQTKRLRGTYADVSRRVPIRPLCGGILNQVDVLALCVLS